MKTVIKQPHRDEKTEMKTIYVVSDKFINITDGQNIVTFSSALTLIEKLKTSYVHLSLEQGISEEQVSQLYKLLADQNKISLQSYFDEAIRCPSEFTHKHKNYNTLISEPKKISENIFSSILMIDERCAELSDHVTGKHLQFMVLIEAARQMVNAVTEMYFSTNKMIFLASNISIDFNQFVYPLKTYVDYTIVENKLKFDGNGRMQVKIEFTQYDQIKSSVLFNFTVMDKVFISKIETSSVEKVINQTTSICQQP